MRTKKVKVYEDKVKKGVSNEYPTPELSLRQPFLAMCVGVRNSGKSRLCSRIIEQAKTDKTFNSIYIITPSFASNRHYFGQYIPEQNVYEPTKDSISKIIERVNEERDEFESYLKDLEEWNEYQKDMKQKDINVFTKDMLLKYLDLGFLDGKKPTWKYGEPVEPPKSLLILDDVLSSPAISNSSGIVKVATLNRHISPLSKEFKDRSACGLSCIILTQTYSSVSGISRVLRENLSVLILFNNKQEKQLDKIRDELGNVVDLEKFNKAYKYATEKQYGNLLIDFTPKKPEYQFRSNLNEFIIFDENKNITNN